MATIHICIHCPEPALIWKMTLNELVDFKMQYVERLIIFLYRKIMVLAVVIIRIIRIIRIIAIKVVMTKAVTITTKATATKIHGVLAAT